jgi:hypothetical protein
MVLYKAAVHILCLTFYILIPLSDKPVIFYVTLSGYFVHFSCLTYEKTVVLIGTISLLVMRFASQLVKIQIPFTLKMEVATFANYCWNFMRLICYTESQRVRTPFFFHVCWTGLSQNTSFFIPPILLTLILLYQDYTHTAPSCCMTTFKT